YYQHLHSFPTRRSSDLNFLYSIILHTGGSALGEISTRSNSNSSALARASLMLYTPTSTLSPTNLTLGANIFSLILWGFLFSLLGCGLNLFLIAMARIF